MVPDCWQRKKPRALKRTGSAEKGSSWEGTRAWSPSPGSFPQPSTACIPAAALLVSHSPNPAAGGEGQHRGSCIKNMCGAHTAGREEEPGLTAAQQMWDCTPTLTCNHRDCSKGLTGMEPPAVPHCPLQRLHSCSTGGWTLTSHRCRKCLPWTCSRHDPRSGTGHARARDVGWQSAGAGQGLQGSWQCFAELCRATDPLLSRILLLHTSFQLQQS